MKSIFSVCAAVALGACLFVSTVSNAAPTTVPTSGDVHPLIWARSLDLDQLAAHDPEKLMDAAEWLHTWAFMGDAAPVSGSTQQFLAAKYRAKEILYHLRDRPVRDPRVFSLISGMNYGIGELLPEDDVETRMRLYEEMIEVARYCIEEIDPNSAACWHELGVGIGRLSTTRGVAASLFAAKEVEEAWLKSLTLQSDHVALSGDPLVVDTQYGLGVFYRLVPDSWLVKLIARVRGDKEKSVAYFRKAVARQPYRLELQKELAVALLCYGEDADDEAALAEARKLLQDIVQGKFDVKDQRATDDIDRQHAQILLDIDPDKACGYSRDGFEDVSDEAVDKLQQ